MVAGEAAVVIRNDLVPDARADFYAWHLDEHMAERAGIPCFRRGRRFGARGGASTAHLRRASVHCRCGGQRRGHRGSQGPHRLCRAAGLEHPGRGDGCRGLYRLEL